MLCSSIGGSLSEHIGSGQPGRGLWRVCPASRAGSKVLTILVNYIVMRLPVAAQATSISVSLPSAQLLNCSVHQFVSSPIGIDALLDTLWCLICCHGNFATIRTGPHSSNGHVGNLSRCCCSFCSASVDFVSGFVMRIFHYGQMSLSQPFCVIIRLFVPLKYFTTLLAFPVING